MPANRERIRRRRADRGQRFGAILKYLAALIFFAAAILAAAPIAVGESYLIKSDEIRASDILPIGNEKDFVIDRFDGRNIVQFPAAKLKRIFKDHGYEIEIRSPIASFYNSADIDMENIEEILARRFMENYPSITINSIKIRQSSFSGTGDMKITDIEIGENNLKRKNGSFAVWFGHDGERLKRLYFTYEIDASVNVLKAAKAIARGAILSRSNTIETREDFDRVSANPVDARSLGKIAAKGAIKKGDIITENIIYVTPDVPKNTSINVEIVKSGVKISFLAITQKNADIGDIVEVKDKDKRVFRARIINKDLARVE